MYMKYVLMQDINCGKNRAQRMAEDFFHRTMVCTPSALWSQVWLKILDTFFLLPFAIQCYKLFFPSWICNMQKFQKNHLDICWFVLNKDEGVLLEFAICALARLNRLQNVGMMGTSHSVYTWYYLIWVLSIQTDSSGGGFQYEVFHITFHIPCNLILTVDTGNECGAFSIPGIYSTTEPQLFLEIL